MTAHMIPQLLQKDKVCEATVGVYIIMKPVARVHYCDLLFPLFQVTNITRQTLLEKLTWI